MVDDKKKLEVMHLTERLRRLDTDTIGHSYNAGYSHGISDCIKELWSEYEITEQDFTRLWNE